jgi:hypothetical protein
VKAQRQIGIGHISAKASQRLDALGVDPACVLMDHSFGRWGGVLGIRGLLWKFNSERDADDLGGWLSVLPIARNEYLWVLTSLAISADDRTTYIFLDGERPQWVDATKG